MPVKFRRYGGQPADIANYIKDRQCNCRGPFHHCRNTDILHVLRGCKCDHGRMSQLSNPCPCVNLRVTGVNALPDPGFETHVSNFGSSTIPSTPAPTNTGWINQNSIEAERWSAETTDPDTGTYHGRAKILGGLTNVDTVPLIAMRAIDCFSFNFYSAVVQPGDLVEWSIRAKATQVASGAPTQRQFLQWHRSDFSSISFTGITSGLLTTSYATYNHSGVAPAESVFVRAFYHPTTVGTLGSDTFFDIDNASVVVS